MESNTKFMELHFPAEPTRAGNEDQRRVIYELYDLFLKDDPSFHFLYEYDYLLLRFEKKHAKKYLGVLDENNYKYVMFDAWYESSQSVSMHFKFFEQYFHIISVLVLDTELFGPTSDNNMKAWIIERIVHCYWDIANFKTNEDEVLYSILRARLLARGYSDGLKDGKKEVEGSQ